MEIPASPFKGLAPYEVSDLDALFFFGRQRERELIVANLLASRLTVLYGASGVGKTSLLRAGVAHRLRQEVAPDGRPEYAVVLFAAWSDDPWSALRRELAAVDEDREVLLILDQTEEYFLYHGHESGPETFAGELPRLVTDPASRLDVLLSIREDALARLDRFKGSIPNLFANYLRLDHLDRQAARSAILGPVARYNKLADADVKVEEALVQAVLDETTVGRVDLGVGGAGRVADSRLGGRIEAPFLQLVLGRIWTAERAQGSDSLRLATFEQLGGAEEIVRAHLERALSDLDPRERDLAASVFRHLVTPSGAKIAHAVDDLAEYADVDARELRPVVTKLVEERILRPVAPAGDGSDGVPHEIFHDVLGDAVLAWRTRHETERRLEAARRRHRRALSLVAVALAGLLVMTAIAVYALAQRRQAQSAERQARSAARRALGAERAAKARALDATALSLLPSDPARSVALALRASELSAGTQAVGVLRTSLQFSRVRAVFRGGDSGAAFSPDGRRLLTASRAGGARVYETSTRRLLDVLRPPEPLAIASFSPTGREVLTLGRHELVLWRVPGGSRVWRATLPVPATRASFAGRAGIVVGDARGRITVVGLDGRVQRVIDDAAEPAVRTLATTGDGRLLAAAGDGQTIRVFEVATGKRLYEFEQGGLVTHLAFSRSGRRLASAGANKVAHLWDMRLGPRSLKEVGGQAGRVLDAEFSPRGSLMVTASTDGSARVFEIATARLAATLIGHTNLVRTAVFDSKGDFVVTASRDKTAAVWKSATGLRVVQLAGHGAAVLSASFRPHALQVLTASADGTSRLWDPQIQPPSRKVLPRVGPVAALARGGAFIAVGGRRMHILAARPLRAVRTIPFRGAAAVAVSRDGRLVAAGGSAGTSLYLTSSGQRVASFKERPQALALIPDGTLYAGDARGLWMLRLGARPRRLAEGAVSALAANNDGRLIATGGPNGVVTLRRGNGSLVAHLMGHRNRVNSVMFSPNDRLLATASRDKDVRIWSVQAGKSIAVASIHFGNVDQASFSPDGRWIVTAGPATAGLLRVPDAEELLLVRGHAKPLTGAVFATNDRIVTASRDGTVRTYVCDLCGRLPELQALARQRLRHARIH
jgi:WD40 repeat protein